MRARKGSKQAARVDWCRPSATPYNSSHSRPSNPDPISTRTCRARRGPVSPASVQLASALGRTPDQPPGAALGLPMVSQESARSQPGVSPVSALGQPWTSPESPWKTASRTCGFRQRLETGEQKVPSLEQYPHYRPPADRLVRREHAHRPSILQSQNTISDPLPRQGSDASTNNLPSGRRFPNQTPFLRVIGDHLPLRRRLRATFDPSTPQPYRTFAETPPLPCQLMCSELHALAGQCCALRTVTTCYIAARWPSGRYDRLAVEQGTPRLSVSRASWRPCRRDLRGTPHNSTACSCYVPRRTCLSDVLPGVLAESVQRRRQGRHPVRHR